MKILHIGAGKIGRGLIYPTFVRDHDICMVDSDKEHVYRIRNNNGYKIIELDYGKKVVVPIENPRIYTFEEIGDRIDFDVITTSIIPMNMKDIAPRLFGIIKDNKRPIYIVPMENSYESIDILKGELSQYGDSKLEGVYFLGSVIDRIIPTIENTLDIECEKYQSVLIEDRFGFKDCDIGNISLSGDIKKDFDKKYFIVNGLHACAAYLGFLKGYRYIYEIMGDVGIRTKIVTLANCYKKYLDHIHGFKEEDLNSYVAETIYRFSNPSIKDHVGRVGRNLRIKMSIDGRICKPYFFNMENGLDYKPFEEVINASKGFTIGNDYKDYIQCCDDITVKGKGAK